MCMQSASKGGAILIYILLDHASGNEQASSHKLGDQAGENQSVRKEL